MKSREDLQIRQATGADADSIASLGRQTFRDAFGADNQPEDMQAYVSEHFSPSRIEGEMKSPDSTYLLAILGDRLIGYALLRKGGNAQLAGVADPIELARIYILKAYLGRGYGSLLMQACLGEAGRAGHDAIWLGVWQQNTGAIRFYERSGFKIVGTQKFRLGEDIQDDYVMLRLLSGAG
jgi:ribosomal protein S18 acetylase RimI-like enzyme